MRIRKVLLVVAPLTATAAVAASAAFASAPALPGASYPWSQPGTALPTICTQPAFVQVGTPAAQVGAPASSYGWSQPWAAPVVSADAQPPAWVGGSPALATPGCSYAWSQPGTAPVSWVPFGPSR
jgi:hypothetical protein